MSIPVAAVFCMPEEGHLRRMLPIIRGLRQRGIDPHVYTDTRFQQLVIGAGGQFVDIFARYPLAAADDESRPLPCRYVSFAGHFGVDIIGKVRETAPSLVVADTFAVIGRVVADALGVPVVNICSGHNVAPDHFLTALADDPRVAIATTCHRAVERLRSVHGLVDASPFSYVTGISRHLNIYCEPPDWLMPMERQVFEPVAFFGSLPSIEQIELRRCTQDLPYFPADTTRKIYVSFGTVIWRYYAEQAINALGAIADAVATMPDTEAVISLGGNSRPGDEKRLLERANVRVESRVDQWAILGETDIFVTHHGLNSTHEAIFHQVPMLSYPFFWDQPALAARCQSLGLAKSLSPSLRGPVSVDGTVAALDYITRQRSGFQQRLADARQRELQVMADRPAVLDRIAALIS
jgi:UDP:flavonoid glycosyltransferase YjiC (YdhE family)